jgi:hypothetical protein
MGTSWLVLLERHDQYIISNCKLYVEPAKFSMWSIATQLPIFSAQIPIKALKDLK